MNNTVINLGFAKIEIGKPRLLPKDIAVLDAIKSYTQHTVQALRLARSFEVKADAARTSGSNRKANYYFELRGRAVSVAYQRMKRVMPTLELK